MKRADVPAPPAAVHELFGDRAEAVHRYAELLASAGVERGLLGPREIDRLWERHIFNSAVLGELFSPDERVADIGSGAGLPGIPLALARPDIQVTLIEPLLRRSEFLRETTDLLGLDCVVIRGRAEDRAVREKVGEMDAVVSRAVAALDRIAQWSAPLLRVGGRMIAMKGERAALEVSEHSGTLSMAGFGDVRVAACGARYVDPPATVVIGSLEKKSAPRQPGRRRG
ncbi:16S rRNA (guanine(527)-N(7))-methyltransferase RsmG [Mycobacterium sp. SMC-4]|uniref:16S rRNA (guanine(527)-N(7))-methyltransferase RsmG n=1 Tax=Mycobacterium sp. SMC-4 TaxID=2857059 RepID=UPI0021B2480A|nr:16S rRNA (guanine(527)-N(7))-methyltransferase RsmG [Mycobacterium sp. SMC-4]UXA18158.1 16S rRNA (guanine(527)-N(7))-methyltransferase RsmG [Mycobacterium sp. SMC-4]